MVAMKLSFVLKHDENSNLDMKHPKKHIKLCGTKYDIVGGEIQH